MSIESFITATTIHFKKQLHALFSRHNDIPTVLSSPIKYSVLNGGKHIRPLLVYATGKSLSLHKQQLDAAAIAVELIHAYSLIHDDLPAMDDARLRRGKLTCHLKFSEADAILAGDALQMLAMDTLTKAEFISDKTKLALISELATAAGASGMVAGQSLDCAAEGQQVSLAELKTIHALKTGALLKACIRMPAIMAKHPDLAVFSKLASALGTAYQIQDDILDVEADTTTLGKEQGSDAKLEKSTYPRIMGLSESKHYLAELKKETEDCLAELQLEQSQLAELIELIFNRRH